MGSEEPAVPGVTHPVFVRTLFAFVFEHGVPFSWNGSSSLALLLHKVENLFFTALSVLPDTTLAISVHLLPRSF